MAWLRPAVAGLVLSLAATVWLPRTAGAQSFDCAEAVQADTRAVCASGRLSSLDDEMAALYDDIEARALMGTRGAVRDNQRAFLDTRKACGSDNACLTRVYRARIAELRHIKIDVGQGAAD